MSCCEREGGRAVRDPTSLQVLAHLVNPLTRVLVVLAAIPTAIIVGMTLLLGCGGVVGCTQAVCKMLGLFGKASCAEEATAAATA